MKRQNPLTSSVDIGSAFTLELNRSQTCAEASDFQSYAKKHPLWGMPYALPGLAEEEERAVVDWIRAGAPHPERERAPTMVESAIAEWEKFLADESLKGQLVARYIYEHLFYASIRFGGDDVPAERYRLVRSTTPPGSPVAEIPTRGPFDDPQRARVFYRFVRREEPPLEKIHMPYRLDAKRLERWKKLFIEPKYEVRPKMERRSGRISFGTAMETTAMRR